MTTRFYISGALTFIAVVACLALKGQQQQIIHLRQTREELLNGPAAETADVADATQSPPVPNEAAATHPEILELRGEISRLLQRKQEPSARAERERAVALPTGNANQHRRAERVCSWLHPKERRANGWVGTT